MVSEGSVGGLERDGRVSDGAEGGAKGVGIGLEVFGTNVVCSDSTVVWSYARVGEEMSGISSYSESEERS